MDLEGIIIERIKKEGPIPFRDFMEMCLYYPEIGYYMNDNTSIGIDGDYYTSSNVSPAFGAMVARQVEEMWGILGVPEFNIVECGAGTGRMCNDILNYFDRTSLRGSLRYHIVEKNHRFDQCQDVFENKIEFHDSLGDIHDITGCVISNELVDNLPVHLVEMQEDLMEIFVDYKNGFAEVYYPAGEELRSYLEELGMEISGGHRAEICLDGLRWLKEVSDSLQRGFVITIDYGFTTPEYFNYRKNGTIVCYRKHKVCDDPFLNIGSQDITAFVNFNALKHWGSKLGLQFSGIAGQAEFLLSLGYMDFIDRQVWGDSMALEALKESLRARKLLISMGERYKVLIQRKNVPASALSGLSTS